MALVVNLKTVEYLKGRYDRIVRITFRGKTLQSNIVHNAKRVAYFGQTFEWPVARGIEQTESLEILVFNYSKYLSDKLIGSYVLILQNVMESGQLSLSECLVDKNNKMISATVTFDVVYASPGGEVGNWSYKIDRQDDTPFGVETEGYEDELEEERAVVDKLVQEYEEDESQRSLDFGDEEASLNLVMENVSVDGCPHPSYVDLQLDRPKEFEVVITIIEGQQLSGLDIDPVVKVEVGNQDKYTSIKQSTNSPYFNEYFVFDFNEMPVVFLDKIVTISAYHSYGLPGRHILRSGNMVAAKRLIGSFKCDIGMIYTAPDHQFYHKWAVLLNPKDLDSGPKGYIKCNIGVVARGQVLKIPKSVKDAEDKESIEANLLLPQGVKSTRHMAVYALNIYKAEELPQTDLGVIASMHKALTNKDLAYIDACVRVSFVGQVAKTSVIKSYYPEWNECLKFIDMFPPLCNRIKIQLCDRDGLTFEPVATHFIELSQIMDPGGQLDGILPTFGPSWLNMYGSTRQFRVLKDGTEDLNEGLGEGSAFRGRLLLSLRTSVDPTEMASEKSSKVIVDKLRTGLSDHATKKPFLLFAAIYEASMISAKLEDKTVQFEISIGQFGNVLDGRATAKTPLPDVMGDGDDENEDDGGVAGVPSLKQQLLRRQRDSENNLPCRSMTPRKVIQLTNKNYGYLPLDEEKPCLYIVSMFEDIRKRHFNSNILAKIAENLENGLSDVTERINRSDPNAHRRFKGAMEKLRTDCGIYLKSSMDVGSGAGKTKLDQYRIKACKKFMEDLRKTADNLKHTTTALNLKNKIQVVREIPHKIKNYSKDPQHAFPDILVWMICDGERVAYYRIPAKDLLYSQDPYLVGKHCGKRQTIFLKKPGKKSHGKEGWTIQAKLNVFMWLGYFETTIQRYLEDLPSGFEPIRYQDNSLIPPMAVVYSASRRYQFRGYVYQARSIIPADETGLSDPFARILIYNRCANTQAIFECLSPTWDETIILDNIVIYGEPQDIKTSPPLVIVEVYDFDRLSQPEFLGRSIVTPKVNLSEEEYLAPKLEWWDLFRGPHKAGRLLASFEFIEGVESTLPPKPPMKVAGGKVLMNKEKMPLYSVPPDIKPSTSIHRLEILFRGVRDLKKIQLMSVDHPHVMVECSDQMRRSSRIANVEKTCNFESYLQYIDIELPDEKIYWPPLTIRCFETRSFGRSLLVGINTVNNIEEFVYKDNRILEDPQVNEGAEEEMVGSIPGNGEAGTSSKEDVVSEHSIVSKKSKKSTQPSKSVNFSANHEPSRVVSNLSGDSVATRITNETSNVPAVKPKFPPDLLNSGVGLACEPTGNDIVTPSKRISKKTKKELEKKAEREPTPEEMAQQREYRRAQIVDLDWWSKYFASKDDFSKFYKLAMKKEDGEEDEEKDRYDWNMPDYTAIDMNEFGKHVDDLKKRARELEEGGKKKKKKKKMTRKRLKKKLVKFKGQVNDAFTRNAGDDDDGMGPAEEPQVEDNSHIQRLMLYPCGLEEVPEFNGFSKLFRSFQLYRGKKSNDEAEDSNRFSGFFKGQFCIYKLEGEDAGEAPPPSSEDKIPTATTTNEEKSKYRLGRYLPAYKNIEVKVFVYILKAVALHPLDLDGRADPYLILKCGRKKVVDKDNRIENHLNPVFGRMFEFDATFPLDSRLQIEVWDYDSLSVDDLIGETSLDLEDRYFSHHLSRCAVQQKYETFGYNTWRNPLKPSQLLELFCADYGYPKPEFGQTEVKIGNDVSFVATDDEETWEENEQGDIKPTIEHLALKALRNWHTIPGGWPLVPEHVESRPLFCDARPGMEQGHLEMWIDMFPKDSPNLPATIDISPRVPKSYELRCIIWNTDDVVLDDVNFLTGEASSDIFVKGFIKEVGVDDMKTDIHYRSLTGEGNFNWRFVFKFDYLKAENRVVYKKKDHKLTIDEVEYKTPPNLSVQVWDADIVTSDDFLGSIVLDLLNIPRPAKTVGKCSLKMITDESYPRINLFRNKRCKGWWPVMAREVPETDDSDEDNEEVEEKLILKGKVEMELELLTSEDAEKNPVGIAHEEPEGLPKPTRPDTSFLWFMNPLKTLKFIIWKNYKWLLLKLLLLFLLILFLVLFFYNFPQAFVNRIMQTKS